MPYGFNQSGDILANTADGRPLNQIWDEAQEALRQANERRSALDSLLTRDITVPAEDIIQSVGDEELEPASEFGEPKGVKAHPDYLSMGAKFTWLDIASRFTWLYLVEAMSDQLNDAINRALLADSKTTHKSVFGRLFTNQTGVTNEHGVPVFALYNNDGTVPPPYKGVSFLGTHTHYLTTGAATFTTTLGAAQDVEALINAVTEHGFGLNDGGRVVVFANKLEVDVIRTFRAGLGTPAALYDFIPAVGAPAFLSTAQIIGDRAPSTVEGLPVAGSYGDAWIVQSHEVPAGYMLGAVTYGSNSLRNVVSFREHPNAALRGFRLIKGRTPDYPLIDSFWVRGFGTGIRYRGGAAIMQVTAGAFVNPAVFATGVY